MAAGTLEYTAAPGTLGLTYIHGIDVDERFATDLQRQRKGMNLYSLRGAGSAGIDNAHFAFELARQSRRDGQENAGYAEAGYTFANLPWSPDLTYRYARYSKNWDGMFSGFNRGYGTWVQGEVAGNYSGPSTATPPCSTWRSRSSHWRTSPLGRCSSTTTPSVPVTNPIWMAAN